MARSAFARIHAWDAFPVLARCFFLDGGLVPDWDLCLGHENRMPDLEAKSKET